MAKRFKFAKRMGLYLISVALLVNVLAAGHAWNLLNYSDTAEAVSPGVAEPLPVRVRNSLLGIALRYPAFTEVDRKRLGQYQSWRVLSEDHTSTRVTELEPRGNRGTIVLIPGLGVPPDRFRPEAIWFKRIGYTVLIHETRGNGASEGYGTTLGMSEVYDVNAVRKEVWERNFPKPLVLYGQGTGAAAVLRSYRDDPRGIAGLILDGTPASVESFVEGLESCHGVPGHYFAKLVKVYLCLLMDEQAEDFDHLAGIEEPDIPVLLVRGMLDRVSRQSDLAAVQQAMGGDVPVVFSSVVGHEPGLRRAGHLGDEAMQEFTAKLEKAVNPVPAKSLLRP